MANQPARARFRHSQLHARLPQQCARVQQVGDEERQQLWEALWRMWMTKPDFAEIISLKHFHNSSYKEIAAVLDIPIGTVMSRLFNARQDLRERYLEVVSEKN